MTAGRELPAVTKNKNYPQPVKHLKPMALAAGVPLGVSHNQVFYAPHAEAKRLIDTGALGKPVLIRLRLGMGPGAAGDGR